MKRLLDYDPFTGVSTYHEYDPMTDRTYIETVQDVEPFLENNKRLQNDTDYSRKGIKREWWHAATIPISVQYQWMKEGIDVMNKDHWPAVKRKLQDPEWRYLKTTTGRL